MMRFFLRYPLAFLVGMALLILSGCASVPQPEWKVLKTGQVPVIDGTFEDLWLQASGLSELSTPSDHPTMPSAPVRSPATEIRMLWDADALYVFFTCWDERIDFNEALVRDDNLFKYDVCELFIDPVGDARQWIEIQVSPNGQILDLVYFLTTAPEYQKGERLTETVLQKGLQRDRKWNAEGLEVATGQVIRDGLPVAWTVEMAIPASTLLALRGMRSFEEMSLRLNLVRYDWDQEASGKRTRNQFNWVPVLSGCPHISPKNMGFIHLINQNQ